SRRSSRSSSSPPIRGMRRSSRTTSAISRAASASSASVPSLASPAILLPHPRSEMDRGHLEREVERLDRTEDRLHVGLGCTAYRLGGQHGVLPVAPRSGLAAGRAAPSQV